MRPPQGSATSSGWGATKTWVMAGRVYREPGHARREGPGSAGRWLGPIARPRLEAAEPDEWHEHAGAIGPPGPLRTATFDHGQELLVARSDRDHEPCPVGELVAERHRYRRRGGRDDDAVPRRDGWLAETAVSLANGDVPVEAERSKSLA